MSASPTTVVITGTDTGVGKTRVGACLGYLLAQRGLRVIAAKPVESGCPQEVSPDEDGALLALATGQASPTAALCRLEDAVAPPVAADRAGVVIDLPALLEQTKACAQGAEVLLVEGAGGLLSPLSWEHSTLDVAQYLKAPVLVVASNVLGVLNHILLTLRALETAGVEVLGVVLSGSGASDTASDSNLASLGRLRPDLPVAHLQPVGSDAEGAAQLAKVADWVLGRS